MSSRAIQGALLFVAIGALLVFTWRPGPAEVSPIAVQREPASAAVPLHAPPARRALGRAQDAGEAAPKGRARPLVHLAWGSGPDQVGRRGDPEAAAEGPMALALGRDGSLLLLDQVNGRILRRGPDGRFDSPLAVAGASAQDLRADAHGGVAVLDRLGKKTLSRYDSAGALVEERALLSLGLVDAAGATGLYEDANGGLYVEESLQGEGRRVLRGLGGGAPLPGRPSHDGSQLLSAAIVDRATGRLVVRGLEPNGSPRWQTPLSVERTILGIILCDSDAHGGIYVAVLHAAPAARSQDLVDERMELFRLGPEGGEVARVSVPHPPSELESFRELAVAGVGVLWWMHPVPDGSGLAIDELLL